VSSILLKGTKTRFYLIILCIFVNINILILIFSAENINMPAMTKEQEPTDDRSPLWKFVTDHPLVFGAEVLTKLDEIDLKIFYDLCRASRAVVIRSKIELNNEKRYVEDVKSMQEFQLAWEHYRWGERDVCVVMS
jgi:hypothetical protein